MLTVGVDPGATGALVLADTMGRTILAALDMPIVKHGSWKTVDGAAVPDWLDQHQDIDRVVLERADARPSDGKGSEARIARAVGGFVSVLLADGQSFDLVTPTTWKRRAALTGLDKRASLDLARVTFGVAAAARWFGRPKDGGRAEAALLAVHGVALSRTSREAAR